MNARHLDIVVCGARPAGDGAHLITLATLASWTTAVIAAPSALDVIDVSAIEALTGTPVRSTYRSAPGTRHGPAVPDALIVAPATYGFVNKIALGVPDSYALTSVAELIGRRVPTVVVPFVNTVHADRDPFRRAVADLRHRQVRVLLGGGDGWEPHPPGRGSDGQQVFPWATAFRTASLMAIAAADADPGRPSVPRVPSPVGSPACRSLSTASRRRRRSRPAR